MHLFFEPKLLIEQNNENWRGSHESVQGGFFDQGT